MADPIPGWLVECWVLCAFSILIITTRVAISMNLRGFKGLLGDDYLSVITMLSFVYAVASFQLMLRYGVNIGLTDEAVAKLTDQQVSDIRLGATINFVCWFAGNTLLWSCKCCMLFLYSRIISGLEEMRIIKLAAWLMGITYLACNLVNIFKCGPRINKNWQVRPAPGACPAGALNMFVIGISNCVTDIALLAIIIPLLWRIKLPLWKKLFTYLMLCSGIFIVIVSIMRTTYSIMSVYGKGRGTNVGFSLVWATRENFTAVVIVNVPIILSTVQRLSRTPRSWFSSIRSGKSSGGLSGWSSNSAASDTKKGSICQNDIHGRPSVGRRRTETDTYIIYGGDDDSIRSQKEDMVDNGKEKYEGGTARGNEVRIAPVETEIAEV